MSGVLDFKTVFAGEWELVSAIPDIRPLRDLIYFQPISKPGKIGLIHVPDSTKSTRNQTFVYAKVLAAGPNVELAKAGSTIFISEYAIEPFLVDGSPVHMMRERDVVGVVVSEHVWIDDAKTECVGPSGCALCRVQEEERKLGVFATRFATT